MDNTNLPAQDGVPGKKEMRKELAEKIAAAIPELRVSLGDKKFESRVKKAVKHITEGMHKKERVKVAKKAATAAPTVKKAVAKKAKAVKKTASKNTN